MNFKKYLLLTVYISMIIFESGCVVIHGRPFGIEEIEIDIGPPPRPEVVIVTRPPRPSSVHIWIDGHFIVSAGKWVWIEGRWERPPRRGVVWVGPHTRRKGPCWGWTPGHWR
jgi:hypothetical protein